MPSPRGLRFRNGTFNFSEKDTEGTLYFHAAEFYGTSTRLTNLRQFLDYVEAPSQRPGGFWIDNVTRLPRPETAEDTAAPLRLYDHDVFLRHAELLEDIKPAPHCIEDWLALLPDNFQKLLQGTRYHPRSLIIGPEGSKTHLHFDFLHSCGSLAQIVGSKRCILFSPTDSDFLYDRERRPGASGFTAVSAV